MLEESQRMIGRGQELRNKAVSDLDELVVCLGPGSSGLCTYILLILTVVLQEAAKTEPEIKGDDPDLRAAEDALVNAKP